MRCDTSVRETWLLGITNKQWSAAVFISVHFQKSYLYYLYYQSSSSCSLTDMLSSYLFLVCIVLANLEWWFASSATACCHTWRFLALAFLNDRVRRLGWFDRFQRRDGWCTILWWRRWRMMQHTWRDDEVRPVIIISRLTSLSEMYTVASQDVTGWRFDVVAAGMVAVFSYYLSRRPGSGLLVLHRNVLSWNQLGQLLHCSVMIRLLTITTLL